MASKPLIIASLIGASIGVPYFAARSKDSGNITPAQSPASPNAAAAAAPAPPLLGAPSSASASSGISGLTTSAGRASSTVPRSPSVDQALRFNVTKEWVYRSWDRKSSGPTDVGLFAVRVPLVSGTQSSSLAGSLTYYFNVRNQVEHISFRGRTGDPARLIRFLMQAYQFEPAAAPAGEQLYQVADRGGVHSELRARPESVVSTASPHGSYAVELELAQPGSKRYLPPRGPFLQVPQTPDAIAPPASANAATPADAVRDAGTTGSSYLDKFRFATPQEEGQAQWTRWPD